MSEQDDQEAMNQIDRDWLAQRAVIATMFTDLGQPAFHAEHNAAAVIARLSHAGWTITKQET